MITPYEFDDADLKIKADQLAQSIQADAAPKSRHEELDALADFIRTKLRWATKADKPNYVKTEALDAIEALKKGDNVKANNQRLRGALSIIKAAEEQSLTVTIFHTQNQLATEQHPDNTIAQALLNLTQVILDFKEATLTQESLSLGLKLETFGAFKRNLEALDGKNKKTWAPVVTDDASLEIARSYLHFLLFTSKHIQRLPIEGQAPSIVFNLIANALNYEGHTKPYDQYDANNPTKNSVIDITRKRIEIFQGEAVDVNFVDGDNAIVEYAQQFVQTCDQHGKFGLADIILDTAQKVVALNQFDQYFAQSLEGNRDIIVAQVEQLERARLVLQQFNAEDHKLFHDAKEKNEQTVKFVKNILLEVVADDEALQKEINIVCENILVGNGIFNDKTKSREVAYNQLHKIISKLVKNNADELHDLVGMPQQDEPVAEKKSVWQRIKAWFKKAFSKKDHVKSNENPTSEHEILHVGLAAGDPAKDNNAKLYNLYTNKKLHKIEPVAQTESQPASVIEDAPVQNFAGNAARFKMLASKLNDEQQRNQSELANSQSRRSTRS